MDANPDIGGRDRSALLRGVTVAANGVRRGQAIIHDGTPLAEVIEDVQGSATDVAEVLASGPDELKRLYEGMARLAFWMWRRCDEQGVEE